MDTGPEDNQPDGGPTRAALEELIYRPGPGEAAIRRPSPWLTVPVTLAAAVLLAATAFLLGRRAEGKREPRTVDVVLQETPDAPGHAAAPAPAPARAAAPGPQSPAPAPAALQPTPVAAPPPVAAGDGVPDATPRELPKEDHSRQQGGGGGEGSGTGTGTGGGGAGAVGTGAAGGGAGGRIIDLDGATIQELSRPPRPDYPPMARSAGIQGTVVVQLLVGADGVPTSGRALEGPFMLRSAAVAHALGFRFNPYQENGAPVIRRFTIKVTYRIN